MKTSTLERLIPEQLAPDGVTGKATLEHHLQRYEFAAKFLRPGRLLDIACGVGYGTRLMTDKVSEVKEAIGVDLSREAIEYAMQHYRNERIKFYRHNAMSYQDEQGFDSIVSLETIEHVHNPAELINHLISLLRHDGVFIASVPFTPTVDVNPYHSYDFTERSFRRMMKVHKLKELSCLRQVQPFSLIKALKREESRMTDMRQNILSYYIKHPWAFANRLLSTLRYGFTTRYLTIAWQKEG